MVVLFALSAWNRLVPVVIASYRYLMVGIIIIVVVIMYSQRCVVLSSAKTREERKQSSLGLILITFNHRIFFFPDYFDCCT